VIVERSRASPAAWFCQPCNRCGVGPSWQNCVLFRETKYLQAGRLQLKVYAVFQQKGAAMSIVHFLIAKISRLPQDLACFFYMPSPTGSYEHGHQSLGTTASSSVSHNNWPEAARKPMPMIKISPRAKS